MKHLTLLSKIILILIVSGLGINQSSAQHAAAILGNPLATQKFSYDPVGPSVNPVPVNRSNPNNVLGAPQDNDSPSVPINFYSLGVDPVNGIGGNITVQMDAPFYNGFGIDLFITETTYGSRPCSGPNRYPERAKVWVAQVVCDPETTNPTTEPMNWFYLGEVCATEGGLDFSLSEAGCLSWALYIHVQDVTDVNEFLSSDRPLDGYDIDGFTSFYAVPSDISTSGLIFGKSIIGPGTESVLGTQKSGAPLPSTGVTRRNDMSRALGAPEGGISASVDALNSFVSLGFRRHGGVIAYPGGQIVIELDRTIYNQPTDLDGSVADLLILETSYNSAGRTCASYREHARVFGKECIDDEWVELKAIESNLGGTAGQRIFGPSSAGLTMGSSSICKDGKLDLNGLDRINYVKIVDNTNPASFNNSADGFDVNAVVGINQCGGGPSFRIESYLSLVPNEVFSASIFPNPAVDNFSVEIETSDVDENIVLQIIDLTGRVVQRENFIAPSGSMVINNYPLGKIPTGIYLVSIESANGKVVQKLIKQ